MALTAQTVYLAIGSAYASGVLTEISGAGYARGSASAAYDPVTGTLTVQGAEIGPGTGTGTAGTTIAVFDASTGGNLMFAFPAPEPALASATSISIPGFVAALNPIPSAASPVPALSTVGVIVGGPFNGAAVQTSFSRLTVSATGTLVAAGALATLTDGTTISWDVSKASQASVTIASTGRTLTMSNPTPGQVVTLEVVQDGSGSRTITTYTNVTWAGGSAPTLSTAAGAVDVLRFTYNSVAGKWRGETVGKAFA